MGAEKAGNKDGTIPAWTGGLTAPPSRLDRGAGLRGSVRQRQVKFTISAANADAVQGQPDGGHARDAQEVRQLQDAGLRDAAYGVRIRRRCTTPSRRRRQSRARADSASITSAARSVPFPIPKSGLEAIWNHTVALPRRRSRPQLRTFPVRANGDYYKIGVREYRIFNAEPRSAAGQPAARLPVVFHRARDARRHGVPGARAGRPGEAATRRVDLQRRASAACVARRT